MGLQPGRTVRGSPGHPAAVTRARMLHASHLMIHSPTPAVLTTRDPLELERAKFLVERFSDSLVEMAVWV